LVRGKKRPSCGLIAAHSVRTLSWRKSETITGISSATPPPWEVEFNIQTVWPLRRRTTRAAVPSSSPAAANSG
jgi:hypothetical protein